MAEPGLDALEQRALDAAAEALGSEAVVLYTGGVAGVVLLHLLRRAGGGGLPLPVIFIGLPSTPSEEYRFAAKLKALWALGMEEVRPRGGPDAVAGAVGKIARDKPVISQENASFEGGKAKSDTGGRTEYRPLSGFDEAALCAYAEKHGLPLCSLGCGGVAMAAAASEGRAEDDEVAGRLKELGYF